jgi:predicted ester cyclase
MTSEITSPAANVELVRAGFQAFNAGDVDECMTNMAPDFVINLAELPEPEHGREVWRQGFEMMKHAFPDLQAHIEDIFAAQDKVAVRLRFRGTHSGEFLGFHPPKLAVVPHLVVAVQDLTFVPHAGQGHVISSMSWNRMTPNQSLFSSRMTCSVAAATSRTCPSVVASVISARTWPSTPAMVR